MCMHSRHGQVEGHDWQPIEHCLNECGSLATPPSVWAALAKKGVSVGERNLMIAATAIAHGSALATCDARSFPKIPGLTVRRV
jgi:hypothetical protein